MQACILKPLRSEGYLVLFENGMRLPTETYVELCRIEGENVVRRDRGDKPATLNAIAARVHMAPDSFLSAILEGIRGWNRLMAKERDIAADAHSRAKTAEHAGKVWAGHRDATGQNAHPLPGEQRGTIGGVAIAA